LDKKFPTVWKKNARKSQGGFFLTHTVENVQWFSRPLHIGDPICGAPPWRVMFEISSKVATTHYTRPVRKPPIAPYSNQPPLNETFVVRKQMSTTSIAEANTAACITN